MGVGVVIRIGISTLCFIKKKMWVYILVCRSLLYREQFSDNGVNQAYMYIYKMKLYLYHFGHIRLQIE